MRLHIDLETRSAVDLRHTGQYVYAEAPSTEITTVGWAIDTDAVRVWLPSTSTWSAGRLAALPAHDWLDVGEMPDMLFAALADPAVLKVAHNASFERTLLSGAAGRRAGFPSTLGSLAQWDCTAARAACYGLPRTLAGAAAALDIGVEKDSDGHRLMLQMCKPRRPRKDEDPRATVWFDDADRVVRQALYCRRDVEAEQAIDAVLPALAPEEKECWQITEQMNDDGVLVDDKLLVAVSTMIEIAEDRLNARLADLTRGGVKSLTDHGALRRWLLTQGVDDAEENGVDKAAVAAMIENPDLPVLVREVLQARRDGGGSSAKKWKAILARLSDDGRARGGLVYCGAAATRRWCIAEGTPVLVKTPAGVILDKPIECVEATDLVWDGDAWVSHEGVVFSGVKDVIEHDGVVASSNHRVYYADDKATTLGDAAARGLPLFRGNSDPWV